MNNDIDRILDLINRLTHLPGKTWQEKRDAVIEEASSDQKTALIEFCSWFNDLDE